MSEANYSLSGDGVAQIAAPELAYLPPSLPRTPRIGLIGCGGISETHLEAYRAAGYEVVALGDRTLSKAQARAAAFFPDAVCTTDPAEVLAQNLDAVDLTPHPADRLGLIEQAIDAGVPILSQKPLADDLDTARRLVARAAAAGVPFAVNQNGRFAPHLAWLRSAVNEGLVGEVNAVRVTIAWDHNWVAGTRFDEDPDLLLLDFGIHWFDLVASLIPGLPAEVHAAVARASGQSAKPPLTGTVSLVYPGAHASLAFDGSTRVGQEDRTLVVGSLGSLRSVGPPLEDQQVTLVTAAGACRPELAGTWFPGAFHGTMAELLDAAWSGREPSHSARDNLRSLEICHRAVAASKR